MFERRSRFSRFSTFQDFWNFQSNPRFSRLSTARSCQDFQNVQDDRDFFRENQFLDFQNSQQSRLSSSLKLAIFSKLLTVKTCQDDRDSRSLKLVDLKTIKSTISKTLGSQNLPKLSGYLRRSKTLKIFETCKTLKNQDSQNSQQPRDLPRLSGLKVHQSVKRRTTPSVKIEFQSDTEYPRHWQPALGDSRLVGGSQVPLVPFTSDPRPRNNCLRPSSPVVQPLHLREPAG